MAERFFANRPDAVADPASLPERVALLIGNGAYPFGALQNPAHDIALVEKALSSLGFVCRVVIDAGKAELDKAIAEFGSLVRGGPKTVALFYYAGHGIQWEGRNYLIPVGANIPDVTFLALEAVPIGALIQQLATEDTAAGVVILDACRNNPVPLAGNLSDDALQGLAAMSGIPDRTAIVFSTAADSAAADGDDGHGPFALSFARQLSVAGRSLSDVLIKTAEDVAIRTNRKQRPALFFQGAPPDIVLKSAIGDQTLSEAILEDERRRRIRTRRALWGAVVASLLVPAIAFFAVRLSSERTQDVSNSDRDNYGLTEHDWCCIPYLADKVDVARAWKAVAEGVAAGEAKALYLKGTYKLSNGRYGDALGTSNTVEGIDLMTRASTANLARAQYDLGTYYEKGFSGVARDPARAWALYRQSAEAGNPFGQTAYGSAIGRGIDGAPSANGAAEWFRKAVAQNFAPAMTELGKLYTDRVTPNLGVNWDAADGWFRRAADLGDGSGASWAALLRINQLVGSRGVEDLQKYLDLAVKANDPWALYQKGLRIARGDDGAIDTPRAEGFYLRAARAGQSDAAYALFNLYDKGLVGGRRQPRLAVEWLQKAADAGLAPAAYDLGHLYETGYRPDGEIVIPVDCGRAANLYQKAAQQGFARAQLALGLLNDSAKLRKRDRVTARRMFILAARGGDQATSKSAQEAISRLAAEELLIGSDVALLSGARPDNPYLIIEGNPDANIFLTVYTSFDCASACDKFHRGALPIIRRKYVETGFLRILYRFMPQNAQADFAARLVRCAPLEKRLPALDKLILTQAAWLGRADPEAKSQITQVLESLGINQRDIESCTEDQAAKGRLQLEQMVASANTAGATAPILFLHGRRLTANDISTVDIALSNQLPLRQ